MASPNYGFEKRQRELAKKKKQDEKDARKRAARQAGTLETSASSQPTPAGPTAQAASLEAGPKVHRRTG